MIDTMHFSSLIVLVVELRHSPGVKYLVRIGLVRTATLLEGPVRCYIPSEVYGQKWCWWLYYTSREGVL
jgi:hypothetical protein